MFRLALASFAAALGVACSATSQSPSLFEPIEIDFDVVWDREVHPFTGAATIDVDGDGWDEVFISGGLGQADRLYTYRDGRLEDVIDGTGLSSPDAGHGVTSLDLDADGDVDLIVARASGVVLYLNDGAGRFAARELVVPSQPVDSEPFQVAVSDYDRDGDVDLYVSYFVAYPAFKSATFNEPGHAKTNRLLRNDGDLRFVDVTERAGVAGQANTFGSILLDLNGDHYDDLVVAQNTWEVEFFENDRDGTFTRRAVDTGYGFWMGVGVGDIDADGDQDLFFPNVGTSIPLPLTRGDIRPDQRHTHDWALLRNDGDFTFAEVSEEWGIDGEGFAWGGVFEDVDLDGRLDLFVAQNYIKWPFHYLYKLPGKAYRQTTDETGSPVFVQDDAMGLANERFGQSSLFVDLDRDGRLDYFWINMGDEQAAYLNRGEGHFVSFRLPDDLTHLGTTIRIETEQGESYTRQLVSGQGYLTDQAPELVFGLGEAKSVKRAILSWPDGTQTVLENPAIDRRHAISRSALGGARER